MTCLYFIAKSKRQHGNGGDDSGVRDVVESSKCLQELCELGHVS